MTKSPLGAAEIVRRTQITARDQPRIVTPGAIAVFETRTLERTCEAETRWATLDQIVAEIFTRKDFFVRARLDRVINDRIPGRIGCHIVEERLINVELWRIGDCGAIDEGLPEVARF